LSENEVESAAARLLTANASVVVKMVSKRITHKSDTGGVVLNLTWAGEARQAAIAVRTRFAAAYPDLALDGFTVQPMVRRSHARELIAGLTTDPTFGPVVVFGAGGTAVEVVDDTAVGLAPLDAVLAEDIVSRTRISRLLAAYRDVPAADQGAVTRVLIALSQLAVSVPAIRSIDINPLLASAEGVIALDARIEIDPEKLNVPAPNPSLILSPYPWSEQSSVTVGGKSFTVRPIRPADAALYPLFLERTDPEDMRRRFLSPTPTIPPPMLTRLTQLDYDRDIAFVALEQPLGELAGIVRYGADPDRRAAEYGVLVRSDLKGRGLGRLLMQKLIGYARQQGLGELFGTVLADNEPMLRLCRELGFAIEHMSGEALYRTSLRL
jgi:acetyltransferase